MPQRPAQRTAVAALHGVEHAAAPAQQQILARGQLSGRRTGPQPARAQHGRGGERHRQRHQNGRGERDRELVEQPPHDAPHEQNGREHRNQRHAHRQHREPHLAHPGNGRLEGLLPLLQMPRDVLQHHDGVIHHEARGNRQRHEAQVVEREAGQIHHGKGADERHRHRNRRNGRGPSVAQEQVDHQNHQPHRDQERTLHVAERSPDGGTAVHDHLHVDRGRNLGLQPWQRGLDPLDGRDDVGPRLPEQNQHHARLAVDQPRVAQIHHPVAHRCHVGEPHGPALAVAHDERQIVGRMRGLVVGLHLPQAVAPLHHALGPVRVGARNGRAHRLQADAVARKLQRVGLDPHRRLCPPAHGHIADALDLQQLLPDDGVGRVVHLPRRERPRREPDDHDRRIGRIGLAVGRVARHARGQQAPRRVDGRLHIARRAVDVAAQVELQRDAGAAQRAGGGDLAHPGNAPQRPLQRRGHRGRHGLGARPRQARPHLDGGEIHLRQRRHRQQPERHHPRQHHRQREQHGRHRPADESLGQHQPSPRPAAPPGAVPEDAPAAAASAPTPAPVTPPAAALRRSRQRRSRAPSRSNHR